MLSARDAIIGLGLSLVVGLVGALPFAMLALLFGGADAARDIYLLEAGILASWLPIKFLVDTQIKGQSNFRLPNISLNQLSLFVMMLGLMIIIPVMYFATFTAFLVGALLYSLGGNNLAIALGAGLFVQFANIYRGALREKQMGVSNNVFVRFQDFGNANMNINIDPEQVVRNTPRQDSPQILHLPEENLRDRSYDSDEQNAPATINIDPSAVKEKSGDDE